MSEAFIGQIAVFGFNFAPRNWVTCQGQLMPISQNTQLFSLLGTQFGGNGTSNFGLPDFGGNVVVGQGTSITGTTYEMGETGGEGQVTLTQQTTAVHNHSLGASTAEAANPGPAGGVFGDPLGGSGREKSHGKIYNQNTPDTQLAAKSITSAGNPSPLPHNNVQPYLVLNYCICINGVFPSRN